MSVLSISEVRQLSVTAMALRLEYILDLARLLRSSDLLKMLRALHVKIQTYLTSEPIHGFQVTRYLQGQVVVLLAGECCGDGH